MTVSAPSRWLADCAKSSSLLRDRRIENIPNGLDLSRFGTVDRRFARGILALPADKKLIVFGAQSGTTDANKGFHLLASALRILKAKRGGDDIELVVFGSREPSVPIELPYKATYLGWLHDDVSMNLLYAAADVVVAPSLLENLPFTVMEAMASGTPAVAFRQGGVPDLIDHLENGYLARPYEPEDLADGIAWVLADGSRHQQLSLRAREKIEDAFDVRRVAQRYLQLYREVIAARS